MKKITIGNHLTLYLVALCALLAGLLWIQNHNGTETQQSSPPVSQADLAPPTRGTVAAPSLAAFSEVLERPLFVIGRRPPPEPEPERTKTPVIVTPLSIALEGIVITPSENIAVIFDYRNNEILSLSKGMVFQGWELTEISEKSITFTRGEQSQQLTLEEVTS